MNRTGARISLSIAISLALLSPATTTATEALLSKALTGPATAPVRPGLSRPLRELAASVPGQPEKPSGGEGVERFEPELPHRPFSPTRQPDGAVQSQPGGTQPTPGAVNFEGIDSDLTVAPPDTEGRVGPNEYVQWVNLRFQFFDKSGNALIPPVPGNILWNGFGGDCETHNQGDPIAQYDRMADRWVLTQFVVGGAANFSQQCVAVSQTGDPLGAYYLYDFVTDPVNFVDYPHWGMWNDNYYMTAHIFNNSGTAYLGQGLYVFDRTHMLSGEPAGMLPINLSTLLNLPYLGGALPGDIDSILAPPNGSYEQILAPGSPEIDGSPSPVLHEFTITFNFGTQTGYLTRYPDLAVAPFVGGVCGFSRDCVVQPPPAGTADGLDAISDRLMYRVAYRNFGDHESIVLNHTVQNSADATGNTAAPRWYEVRTSGPTDPNCPSGYPCVYQQSTYAPDLQNRWMGSVAMDASGDMAFGYSESSLTTFPSVFVTGRLAGDPLSTMGGEVSMVSGGGSQIGTANRWGDYSSMTVDPTDGCTFWYTQEYEAASGSFNWSTRVGTFSFPGCAAEPQAVITGTVTLCATGEPVAGATVTAYDANSNNIYSSTADATGHYSITVPPGSFYAVATDLNRNCYQTNWEYVTVANGQTAFAIFCLNGGSNLQIAGDMFLDANGNPTISPNDCVTLQVSVGNPGCADYQNPYGTLASATPGVTVNNAIAPYPTIGIVSPVTNLSPFTFSTDSTYDCRDISLILTMANNIPYSGSVILPFTISSPCPVAAPQTFSGSLSGSSATQTARLGRNFPSDCAGKGCPGPLGSGSRFYDEYSYTNTAGGPACVTVDLTPACGNGTVIQSDAYLTSFDPANLCANYLGDWGNPGGGTPDTPGSYSFEVPAGATFLVNVNTVTGSGATCPGYTGTVTGLFDFTPGPGTCAACPAIGLAPSTLPNATQFVPYPATTLAASGGSGPYQFFVTQGNLPFGLTLGLNGLLSGNVGSANQGTYVFTVTATDSNGCSGSQQYFITVSCAAISLSPLTLPPVPAGGQLNTTVTATGGAPPYSFHFNWVAYPPCCINIDSSGNLTGYVPNPGTYNFLVEAEDANQCVGDILYDLNVLPLAISSISPECGPSGGGTTVVITGSNFAPGDFVSLGGYNLSATFVSSTELDVVTLPGAAGSVSDVVVATPGGYSATLTNGWGYDFLDVPTGNPFHDFVCKLVRNGITAGCGGGNYCPSSSILRNQMAVFILRGVHGSSYTPPPATGTVFADVPASAFAAAFIEECYHEGIMGVGEDTSCGAGDFCPADAVTRLSMAYILLRGEHGGTYTPPAANCTSFPFTDVSCPSTDADFVSELVTEGITAGCTSTMYCPTNPVTRVQMAVFLTATFNLQ